MTKDELKDCLGTIAQSGTSKFLKALKVHLLPPIYIHQFVFSDDLASFVADMMPILSYFSSGEQRAWFR
jgi:hypothetical protein